MKPISLWTLAVFVWRADDGMVLYWWASLTSGGPVWTQDPRKILLDRRLLASVGNGSSDGKFSMGSTILQVEERQLELSFVVSSDFRITVTGRFFKFILVSPLFYSALVLGKGSNGLTCCHFFLILGSQLQESSPHLASALKSRPPHVWLTLTAARLKHLMLKRAWELWWQCQPVRRVVVFEADDERCGRYERCGGLNGPGRIWEAEATVAESETVFWQFHFHWTSVRRRISASNGQHDWHSVPLINNSVEVGLWSKPAPAKRGRRDFTKKGGDETEKGGGSRQDASRQSASETS